MEGEKVIRVLQVGMSPYYGGTEAFLMSQYKAIDRTKVQFDFLNVYDKKIACQDEIKAMGGRIYCLDMSRHHGLKNYYKNVDTFFAENANQFDVVHCNFQSLINTDIIKYAKKYGIGVRIVHAHNSGYGTEPSLKQKLLISINKFTLGRYATHYFACSSLAAEWMFGRTATIIKNAIDVDKYLYSTEKREVVRKQLGIKNEFVIIFVGRLDPQKNPLFLFDVFCEFQALKENAKLVVVGDGILREDMNSRIEELGLTDCVEMLGNRKDVHELLQAADAFILPSIFEGLGIVLIEAQAAGLPTFTSAGVVPDDAKISELLEFVPLTASPKEWASRIVKNGCANRENMKEVILKAGYDNYENAKKLEKLYLSFIAK